MAVTSISTERINSTNMAKTSAVSNSANAAIQFPSANGCVRTREEVRKAIVTIAKKYNIDKETGIKIVQSVCNQKGELLILSDEEYNTKIKQIDDAFRMNSVKSASEKFSKSNTEKTLKWFCNEPKDDNGFLNLLKASGHVSADKKSLNEVSDSELKTAMEKLIKTPEMEKAFSDFEKMTALQKQEAVQKQVNYLNTLLANVSEDQKIRIFKIFTEITKDSGAVPEGFRALKSSFKTKEALQNFLNKFTPSELAFIGVNQEDIALVSHLHASELEGTEEGKALCERIKSIAEKFKSEHKEEIESITAKKSAQMAGEEVEYTEEEKYVIDILSKVEEAALSGFVSGIFNSKIDEKGKTSITRDALAYAEQNGIKDNVLSGINDLISLMKEEHKEYLGKDFDEKKLTEMLDNLSDGKYSQIVEAENNAKSQIIADEAGSTSVDFGYDKKATQEQIADIRASLQEKQYTIAGTAKKTGTFVVEKQNKKPPVGKTAGQIRDTYSSMMGFVRDALPKETYTNLTSSAHALLITCLKAMPKTFSFYLTSQTSNTVKTDLAKEGIEVDVRGTDYYTKKQIEEIRNA